VEQKTSVDSLCSGRERRTKEREAGITRVDVEARRSREKEARKKARR